MGTTQKQELTILVTSDIHGYVFPTDYRTNEEKAVGLSKLANIIERERACADQVLLIDNGDVIQGSPLTLYYAKHMSSQIHPLIKAYNQLHYDAAILGNHEFNFGCTLLKKAIADSNFPWICANCLDEKTGHTAFGPPYDIKNLAHDFKVAILGLTTHYIPNWEHEAHIRGLRFVDALHTAQHWVPKIHQEHAPDILIVAYHGGFERDLDTGDITEKPTGENQAFTILHEVAGIDVLLTGHQHRMIAGQWNGVACLQPGSQGQVIGKVVLTCSKEQQKWHIRQKEVQLIHPDSDTPTHPEIIEVCAEAEQLTQHWLDQTLAITAPEAELFIVDPFHARTCEHPLIELIQHVQMEATNTNISCTALFSNEPQGFRGKITMRDLWNLYMFPNTLKVLRLTGRDIKEALEKSAAYFTINNQGQLDVSPNYLKPKPQHYNYDMWEGIYYELDITKPIGYRVTRLETMDGKPLNDESAYDVVMNNYRASGGGEFKMFQDKPIVREIQTDMVELLAEYIQKRQVIDAQCNRNWRVIPILQ